MNQAILFNDDLAFNKDRQMWSFSGLISGNKVTIFIMTSAYSENSVIDDSTTFDWEEAVETWLEENEPNESDEIHLHIHS
jgi:hypothetical protein